MANIDDVISLNKIISNPHYDFLSHLMTNNDDNDNDDVLTNVSPYDNVDSNCIYIDEFDYIKEFKDKKNPTFIVLTFKAFLLNSMS
jgi:hypothetical protein